MSTRKRFVYERLKPTDIQIRAVGMWQCREVEGYHWSVGNGGISKEDMKFIRECAESRGHTKIWLHYDSVINLNHVLWETHESDGGERRRVNVRVEA